MDLLRTTDKGLEVDKGSLLAVIIWAVSLAVLHEECNENRLQNEIREKEKPREEGYAEVLSLKCKLSAHPIRLRKP